MEKKDAFSKTDSLKNLFQKKNALFWIGIAGILLIWLSDGLFSEKSTSVASSSEGCDVSAYDYCQELQQQLEEMLAQVEGAGEVRVMVTLESSGEWIYAQDEQSDTQTDEAEQGLTQRKNSYKSEHILVATQQGKEPLVESRLEPEIRGVAVVCQGGDDITVIKRITELVSVVLNLSSNRICVTKMI